jgi:hypothetical protein
MFTILRDETGLDCDEVTYVRDGVTIKFWPQIQSEDSAAFHAWLAEGNVPDIQVIRELVTLEDRVEAAEIVIGLLLEGA